MINTLSGKSKTLTYDHHFDHDYEQAYSYLTEGGCKVSGYIYDQKSGDTTLIMDRVENQLALIELGLA